VIRIRIDLMLRKRSRRLPFAPETTNRSHRNDDDTCITSR